MTIAGSLISGCAAPPPAKATPTTATVAVPAVPVEEATPQDAKRTVQQFFQLQLYQLALPEGFVSRNETFWKPFDETFLGIWQHDLLHKNGIRVGRAPLTELKAIQHELDDAERTDNQLVGTQAKDVEMELRTGVPQETLFSFDGRGLAEGHDFYNVDNLLVFGFRQMPRRPDRVRLDITPAVREQQRLVMDKDSPKWIRPRVLYEVGINVEIGVDECLVISPSSVALGMNTSVGRTFMMEDRAAARVEKVLVVIPQIQRAVEEVMPVQRSR